MTCRSIVIPAERRSRSLDGATALWSLQPGLKIEDEFPAVHEQQFGFWALEKCSYEHSKRILA